MKEKEKQDMAAITNDWLGPMSSEFKEPYHKELYKAVKHEYETKRMFPEPDDILDASAFTPLADMKAVILGQDPYHNYGQTHGLRFLVEPDVDILPPLVNIHQELHDDSGCYIPNNGYLKKQADQGVMLSNTVLTVEAHQASSHRNIGWEKFTDAAISTFNQQDRPMVFILRGCSAQIKKATLDSPRHLILEASHPSPLSAPRGFFGSRLFSRTNALLAKHGLMLVDWQIRNV